MKPGNYEYDAVLGCFSDKYGNDFLMEAADMKVEGLCALFNDSLSDCSSVYNADTHGVGQVGENYLELDCSGTIN